MKNVWKEVQTLGPQAGRVVLTEATKVYSEAAHTLSQFQDAIEQTVVQAHRIQKGIEKKNITTVKYLAERLSHKIATTSENLKDIVTDPLPKERGERARARARIVNKIMDQFQLAYIQVLTEVGFPREEAIAQFSEFAPKLVHVILIIGNIAEEHPELVAIVIFVVSTTVLPVVPIFRPILTFFGFGPLGPIKGAAAAWAQRTFFGGAVSSGSLFAILQSAGMTDTLQWLDKTVLGAGLTAILGRAIEIKAKL